MYLRNLLVAVFLSAAMAGLAVPAFASVIRDTEIESALLRVIRPMAKEAGLEPDKINVRVVINNQYNAFVTGDGVIYIHSGLLLDAENFLEVAGVMAHELGHIASGHVERRSEVVKDATIAGLLGAVAAIALSASGNSDAAIGVFAGTADQGTRTVLARSRQDEGVADQWAIRLMQSQNLSLHPMTENMRQLAAQRLLPETRQSEYYRTHPSALDRSSAFQDYINRFEPDPIPEPEWMTEQFTRLTAKLGAWTRPAHSIINANTDDTPRAIFRRAIAFFRLSDIDAAADTMQTLLETYPDDAFYREFYGDILLSQGSPQAAAQQYEKALMLLNETNNANANQGQILLSLGRAYLATSTTENYPNAIAALEKANRLEPKWAFVKRQLGISYGRAGRVIEADLTLAEEALLTNNPEMAKRLAKRVNANPDATAFQKRQASDILLQTQS